MKTFDTISKKAMRLSTRLSASGEEKVKDNRRRVNFDGKVGLKTRYNGRIFLTVPSHVIAKALEKMDISISSAAESCNFDVVRTDNSATVRHPLRGDLRNKTND